MGIMETWGLGYVQDGERAGLGVGVAKPPGYFSARRWPDGEGDDCEEVIYRPEKTKEPKLPKPCCEGLSRPEITDLLNRAVVGGRLTRRNAYSYWAHEVVVTRHLDGGGDMRIDFMQFEPHAYHTCTDASGIERGIFTCYEVKSCMADLKSGHGLNFIGDVNWLVMPVEMYEPYKEAYREDNELSRSMSRAGCLLYGKARNGWPTFCEIPPYFADHIMRTRSASELLLCMMRALLANSDLSSVDHPIRQEVPGV